LCTWTYRENLREVFDRYSFGGKVTTEVPEFLGGRVAWVFELEDVRVVLEEFLKT
jgi:hypothetical protein